MPRCPKCHGTFHTLEDEPPDQCPFCDYYVDDPKPVKFVHHLCDAGDRCTGAIRTITAGYDAKGRIVDLEPGITITVADHGPTFRHNGCPDLALERFIEEQRRRDNYEPGDLDGEVFRGNEAVEYEREQQARIQHELKR